METHQIVQACFDSILLCLAHQHTEIQNIGIYIFREATRVLCDDQMLKELVHSMLLVLDDSKDSASKAVVSFLAEYISKNSSFLPLLFERADQTENQPLHQNALSILTETFKIQSQLPMDEQVQRMLANFLLARLHDEDLAQRLNATELFARIDLEFIVPKLVSLEMHRDARVRATAHKSLQKIFEQNTESPTVLMIAIDSVR